MQNVELENLARKHELGNEHCFDVRVAFAVACVERVEHLLLNEEIIQSLKTGKSYIDGSVDREALASAASTAAAAARSQAGTNSMDGSGSAAVSSSHAVAAALDGRALDSASYSAYAKVYSYASYAVTDPAAYKEEYQWQLNKLRALTTVI